jgi:hypothetical protein
MFVGDCANGVCPGAAKDAVCTSTRDCNVGLFCNFTATNATCAPQVKAGSPCTNDFMCPQTQGCLAGNCTDYYSKNLNDDVSMTVNGTASSFCRSMLAQSGKCYGNSYGANMAADKNGLVKCDINAASPCNYIDSSNKTFTEDCQCSYDANGQSFCRKPYTEGNADWQKVATTARTGMSSTQCHAMNRFTCWDKPKNFKTDSYDSSIATTQAQNFFYADDCIKKLFNAGEFIKISFVLLAAVLINLF